MGGILLIRHGQASFGAADYDQLSERGQMQARRLGEALREQGLGVTALWQGPMRRHRQTTEALLRGLHAPLQPQECAELAEFDHHEVLLRHDPRYADTDGFLAKQRARPDGARIIMADFRTALARWAGGGYDQDYTESWPVFRRRALAALDTVAQAAQGESCVLVVTSGGVIAAAVQALLDLSTDKTLDLNWRLVNAGVTRLALDGGGRRTLLSLNEHSHFMGQHAALLTWR